ncbi:hypothetical protein Golax_025693 [Gossypium laxum]|uniref:Uncharacterized protein n=1 Tax=Gossypium laxum TaxID=34288 RepID=A0A7J9B4A7_9ROSI|nr:hypothetical protein [Gossypium laxum]
MTFRRRNGWRFFRIFTKKTSSGEPLGYFQMRSYIEMMVIERRFKRYLLHGNRLAG